MSFWTDEDVVTLRRMIEDGATHAAIAETLKRTPAAVSMRASVLGLKMDPALVARRRGEVLAKVNRSPEQRRKVSERRRAPLAWCKPEWRPLYSKLTSGGMYSAAEARAIIEQSHAR